jgi:hypothetical protein
MATFRTWMKEVREVLEANRIAVNEWQSLFPYNFRRSFDSGTSPVEAANRMHRFWWREQEKGLHRQCDKAANCWLSRGHNGDCQPIVDSIRGDSTPKCVTPQPVRMN